METRDIETFQEGMRIFNGELMAEVTRVEGTKVKFRVHNGQWTGDYRTDDKTIVCNGKTWESPPFLEVVEVSGDEAERWYTTPLKQKQT